MILNLLSNALKFTSKGSISIKVKTYIPKNAILVKVIDTGVGISEDDQNKLFSLFGKLKSSEDINVHGIGLGLNICRKLV